MLSREQRRKVWMLIAAIFILTGVISEVVAPGHEQYMIAAGAIDESNVREVEIKDSIVRNTPFQALLPTLLGVREVLASLMWVQADDYFHRGEYRPIIRMIKQITTIDPHQLDVYATGAWHMAYNFMDKRLIDDGIDFLESGCKNNPSVYDLFFEQGYMHYDKTKNYPEAVRVYREASTKRTTTGKDKPPSFVRHQLAHAIEKMGDIDGSLEQWKQNYEIAQQLEAEGQQPGMPSGPNTAAGRHNLYITARRRNERMAAEAERRRDRAEAQRLWQANVALAEAWLKEAPGHSEVMKDQTVAKNQVDRLAGGKLIPLEQTDPKLAVRVERIAPRKLLITGRCDVLDLSRINVRFADKDYEQRIARSFEFKMKNCSLEYDNVSIKQGKFRWLLDLDRDPADMGRQSSDIYPLAAEEFDLVFTYNPRLQAAFIQDRYGWNGEGLTAPPGQLVVDESRAGVMEGKRFPLRLVRKTYTLRREDITAAGKKVLIDEGLKP